jgi:sec-independent protein translocase protein TatC
VQGVVNDDRRMTIIEHLEELRRVLMISAGAWVVATTGCFFFRNWLFDFLERPIKTVLRNQHQHLTPTPIITQVTEPLTIPLKVSAIAGFAVALPIILWQVWTFVSPGLKPAERKFAWPFIVSAVILFAAGGAFAYFVMPIGLNFLAGFLGSNATFLPDLNSYLTFFTILIVIFGATFELPIAILLLGMLGIVSSRMLRSRRKGIWVGIVFVALVVTPGADPFTPTALFIPLIVLFEASILILDKVMKR